MSPVWKIIYLIKLVTKKIISRCYYMLWNKLSVLLHTNYGLAEKSIHIFSMNFQLQSVLEFPISISSLVLHAVFEVQSSGQSLIVIACLIDIQTSLYVPLLKDIDPLGSLLPHLEPLKLYRCSEDAVPFVHCFWSLLCTTESPQAQAVGIYLPPTPHLLGPTEYILGHSHLLCQTCLVLVTCLINVHRDKTPNQ